MISSSNKKPAYTVAELMVALAVAGIIISVTISNMVASQDTNRKKLIFKEMFITMENLFREGILTDEILDKPDKYYFTSKLNAAKACLNSCAADGCVPSDWPLTDNRRYGEPGVLLHNGATICGFNCTYIADVGAPNENVAFDWNGPKGPNQLGEDVIVLQYYYNPSNFADKPRIFARYGTEALYKEVMSP